MKNFEELGLIKPLLLALAAEGYQKPTSIQEVAIPVILKGLDLMGCAQTGTGKTAAFALPTLQKLSEGSNHRQPVTGHIRGLVLAPTRELAAQIGQSFIDYGKNLKLRIGIVHGGVSQVPQVREIQRGVDLLVATPGRLLDLMQQRQVDISKVEILIIDEADQMFDMGFLRDLKRIVSRVPQDRQTLMFSATMPEPIRELARQWLYQPKFVRVAKVSSASGQVQQSVFHVQSSDKPKLLANYIKNSGIVRSIVFTRTKHGADKLVRILLKSGIDAVAIHGNKSQNARTRNLERFKSKRPPVLVATDIAARGIDVDAVSHVINYQLPEVPEVYVHRIGRTGRADASGVAVSFCSPEERDQLRGVERLLQTSIPVNLELPGWNQPPREFNSPLRTTARPSTSPRRTNSTKSEKPAVSLRTSGEDRSPAKIERRNSRPRRKPSFFDRLDAVESLIGCR